MGSHLALDGEEWIVERVEADAQLGLAAVWLLSERTVVDIAGEAQPAEARVLVLDIETRVVLPA